MKFKKLLIVFTIIVIFSIGVLTGEILEIMGNIDSPALPENTASYTLTDIYNRLANGTDGTASTFTEPASGPGSTMYDLNTIMNAAPESDNSNGARTSNVAAGRTFWGLRTDGTWGQNSGEALGCFTCNGTLSAGGRWCDNGDGTVTDMTTGLVWLQDASWGGWLSWRHSSSYNDALTRAGNLYSGAAGAGLTDGSILGDWRLPTSTELHGITQGVESINTQISYFFVGIQFDSYWTSTTYPSDIAQAYIVNLIIGLLVPDAKDTRYYVWPVRNRD